MSDKQNEVVIRTPTIIDNTGAYIQQVPTFKTGKGTFTLIGTESPGDTDFSGKGKKWEETSIGETLDTFRASTGERLTYTRKQIQKWFKDKKIWL